MPAATIKFRCLLFDEKANPSRDGLGLLVRRELVFSRTAQEVLSKS
jgi:hypothetical protein